MSDNHLRSIRNFAFMVGSAFLFGGAFLFVLSDGGMDPEKIGVVCMVFGGVLLGAGFTAATALKSPNR